MISEGVHLKPTFADHIRALMEGRGLSGKAHAGATSAGGTPGLPTLFSARAPSFPVHERPVS